MPTQTVTFTPASVMTEQGAMSHIGDLLPMNVRTFLNASMTNGSWARTITENNGTFTVTNTFTQDAANQYRSLMADVSPSVKSQLAADGWTISFSPETADL